MIFRICYNQHAHKNPMFYFCYITLVMIIKYGINAHQPGKPGKVSARTEVPFSPLVPGIPGTPGSP